MEYQQPPPPPSGGNRPKERPMGVTILAVLYALQGLFMIGLPIMFTAILPFDLFFAEVTIICWAVFGVIALIYFVIAYGLLKGAGWARIVAIIFAIIGLINIPIGTIISIVILIYLFKDEVKAYFK